MSNDCRLSPLGLLAGFLVVGGAIGGSAQSGQIMNALTVPAAARPTDCALQQPASISTVSAFSERVVSLFPANPWSGTERRLVAHVSKAIDATPRVAPDGPPPEARAAAELDLKWADNILEAYHAAYSSANRSEVEVFAVTFTDAKLAPPEPLLEMTGQRRGATRRIVRGTTVIRVSAPARTACFEAVQGYIESLK